MSSGPKLIDTHCHLQSERFDGDREFVLERTLASLEAAVVIGDDIEASRAAAALARRDGVYAAVGLHPYHAALLDAHAVGDLRALLHEPGVVALGEIGLDYFNEYAPRPVQRDAFERQLELACEAGLPVVIHNRESDADCLEVLKDFAPRLRGCIMHCFGSGVATAMRCVDLGFYISFAGNLTYPKAQNLRDAAAIVPLERLLVETDAPYLAPVPLRGQRCEPAMVQHTAACLAQVKGVAPEEIAEITTANAKRVYGI